LGYHPGKVDSLSTAEWDTIFENPEHRIFSIYTPDNDHIGEIHITIEQSLGDAQISILIGDADHWHQGYGTATLAATLDIAFNTYRLFRVWADIPDYNIGATHLFENIGFVHEGTLRKSRPHEGVRHDSIIMGMLSTEFNQK
jgi:RimJ/RimL family protein N-acetyltransferase